MLKRAEWLRTTLEIIFVWIRAIVVAYFVGAITLVFIQGVGETMARRDFEVWEWTLMSLVVGTILIALWNAIPGDNEDSDE